MHETKLHVELLSCTPDGETLCALAAKLCYSGSHIDELKEKVSASDQDRFLHAMLRSGHHSVLEHMSFTFAVEGVSRVLLAQLTRHRIASFSVQSQRYVSYQSGFSYIVPPKIKALGKEAEAAYHRQMDTMQQWYNGWCALLEKGEGGQEDARFVLPNACETRLVLTMNVRELMHFFSLRCCLRAQWEIRAMADAMLAICKKEAPILFEKSGPGCLRGACPEGKKTCGYIQEMRQKYLHQEDE